jgi:hypothetical protein
MYVGVYVQAIVDVRRWTSAYWLMHNVRARKIAPLATSSGQALSY